MFQTKVVEKIKTHIVCFFFSASPAVCETTWENIVHSDRPQTHCMLDTWGYTHTLRICSTYCLSTAGIVARMCLSVTLYVHCLSYYYYFFYVLHVWGFQVSPTLQVAFRPKFWHVTILHLPYTFCVCSASLLPLKWLVVFGEVHNLWNFSLLNFVQLSVTSIA